MDIHSNSNTDGRSAADDDNNGIFLTQEDKEELKKAYCQWLAENEGCGNSVMMFCAIIVLFLIFGCCPCRKITESHSSTQKDSTYVEHKTDTKIEYIHDTTYVPVPAQEKEKTTRDSTSHLDTDLAESDAAILPDGSLFHSLKNKEKDIPVEFDKPVTTVHDTTYIYLSHDRQDVSEDTKEVPRDYTWWDRTRFYGFYVLSGLMALYILFKKFKIVNKIKKLIKAHKYYHG